MSRLLIDENLPFSLVRLLSVNCVHASEIATQASDTLFWNTARQNNWMVLTRDTDFCSSLAQGAPALVTLRELRANLRFTIYALLCSV
jgi:predicted nuclease of predicted toxin-antitoxin system